MNTKLFAMPVLLVALLGMSAVAAAQPSTMPEGATQVPPEMGVVPKKPEADVPPDLKPRKRLQLKPRMKSDELKPAFHPEFKPEMSPGLQPNSQKPLRKDNPPRSGG
jgi:hypothetical protein